MAASFQRWLRRRGSGWLRAHGKRIIIRGEEEVKNLTGPLIIAPNHLRATDPFFIGLALPDALIPFHFLGARWFKTPFLFFLSLIGLIPLFYKLGGVLTVQRGRGLERNLKKPLEALMNGDVVVIFPEGTRNTTTAPLLPLRKGAAVLAIRTGAPIVPVTIRYENNTAFITYGKPFTLTTNDYEEGTAVIRTHMERLIADTNHPAT